MSSTTTKQDTINRTISLAMHAVAKYALEHRLPAPRAIRRPRLGDRAVRVDLFVGEHEEPVRPLSLVPGGAA
jgi:hypothetical protein